MGRTVTPSCPTNQLGTMALLYPLGVGDGPKKTGGLCGLLLIGNAGIVVQLGGSAVFEAATNAQILHHLCTLLGGHRHRRAHYRCIEPAEKDNHSGQQDQ